MARSHSATFGPPIQTWLSRTASTAVRTSSRILRYCATKSSRGTAMGASNLR